MKKVSNDGLSDALSSTIPYHFREWLLVITRVIVLIQMKTEANKDIDQMGINSFVPAIIDHSMENEMTNHTDLLRSCENLFEQ